MTLKERIRSGEAFHIGSVSLDLSGAELEQKAKNEGWDLAFVDLQHTPHTEPQLVAFCKEAAVAGVPVIFRVHHPSAAWLIGRCLDFGAAGVLVPMSEDPAQVADAIRNFYYPPLGGRSCGLKHAYGWQPGGDPRAYADWWNENGILALQLETVRGIQEVLELVQPGIDLLLFGACDLGFSIGASPDRPFASVAESQQQVVEQTRDLDVRVGVADAPFGRFDALSH